MNPHDPSQQQLLEEIAALRREVAQLKATQAAFTAQTELLTTLISIGRTATGTLMLKALLQQSLKIASRLTHAEHSSLFLLNRDGVVVESILARGATIREEKDLLIGKVLQQGLAGWVSHHREVGVIEDTTTDERWVKLPSEPYSARSALCVPLLKGKTLLGLVTLMHSQPGHFSAESTRFMQAIANQMALVLDLAWLYLECRVSKAISPTTNQHSNQQIRPIQTQVSTKVNLSELGIYILMQEGKFLYVNHELAEIFGYPFSDLVALESFDKLVAPNHQDWVIQQVNHCLQGHNPSFSCTFSGQRQDGSFIDVEVYGHRTKFYGKSVIIGILNRIKKH